MKKSSSGGLTIQYKRADPAATTFSSIMEFVLDFQGFKRPINDLVFKEVAVTPLEDDSPPSVYLFEPPHEWNFLPAKYKSENTTASPGTAVMYPMKKSSRYFTIICETLAKYMSRVSKRKDCWRKLSPMCTILKMWAVYHCAN